MAWPNDTRREQSGPLAGVKVLDLARIIAGPLTGMYLADLGADVIKVERPTGDEMRHYGPEKWDGHGSTFLGLNRNKRSLTLDLNLEEDRDFLKTMVESADVLIESFRPGIMQRWGLTYEDLKDLNPKLIYCSITGFGSSGPAAGLGANNLIAEAFGGSISVSAEASSSKMRTGTPMTDFFTGTSAALAITSALFTRQQTGEGCLITTSLLESQTMMMTGYIVGYLASGVDPSPESGLPFTVPNQTFATSDGKIVLAVNSEDMWRRMCIAIGRTDWLEKPEYANNGLRMQRQAEIIEQLEEILAGESREHWLKAFDEQRVTAGPINSVADLLAHPQVQQLEVLLPLEGSTIPDLKTVRLPFTFNGKSWSEKPQFAPPTLGQHTQEIRDALS